MNHLLDPAQAESIEDAMIRVLVAQRFEDVCQGEPYDPELHTQLLLVEVGDTIAALEAASGCAITREPFSERRYGESGFRPGFELLEEHPSCFELVMVTSDGDQGVVIFVPKAPGIDETLTRFCAEFATPAPDLEAA